MEGWNKKRDVTRRYDATATIYDARYAAEQATKIESALKHTRLQQGKVLDMGCGTGILFDYVSVEASLTVGLDISKRTLLIARRRSRNCVNVHLIQADVDYAPFEDGVFDVVFAITVLQNVPSPTETLKEMKRVAKDDAMIVATGLKKIFTETKLKGLLRKAGLNVKLLATKDLQCQIAICIKKKPKSSESF
jgi:ubiquinone/menaquinone biosynthesis C-methylase UbiE